MVYTSLTGLCRSMTAARMMVGIYLAAIGAIVAGFVLSRRAPDTTQPRLQISWSLEAVHSAPPFRPAFRQPPAARPENTRHAVYQPVGRALQLPLPDKARVAQVEERLKDNLTQDLYDNFRLFIYVSKAASGPWAQQMYVFRKEPGGDFTLLYRWPVSTGRESIDKTPEGKHISTRTPAGYYEIDRHRFYRRHRSTQWHRSMPYAMFFNQTERGRLTGLAIHAATGSDIAALGMRASAGCIHLPPDAARTLFALVRGEYRGIAPRFVIDHTGTMNSKGIILHDVRGRPEMMPGYRVLVLVENYGGRNIIAAM